MSFFLVKTDAVKDLCSLLSQPFVTITQSFSRSGRIPSISIDLSNTVNLCVVLAFSPKPQLTVLFNFPVHLTDATHLPFFLSLVHALSKYQSIRNFSVQTDWMVSVDAENNLALNSLASLPETFSHLPCNMLLHPWKRWTPLDKSLWGKFGFAGVGLFCL